VKAEGGRKDQSLKAEGRPEIGTLDTFYRAKSSQKAEKSSKITKNGEK